MTIAEPNQAGESLLTELNFVKQKITLEKKAANAAQCPKHVLVTVLFRNIFLLDSGMEWPLAATIH